MPRKKLYQEPMTKISVDIKAEHKEILMRNATQDRSFTRMVQEAIEAFISYLKLK